MLCCISSASNVQPLLTTGRNGEFVSGGFRGMGRQGAARSAHTVAYCQMLSHQLTTTAKSVCPGLVFSDHTFRLLSLVFDLLPSSSQRLNPSALQPVLTDPTLNEFYIISTFKLQSKSSATIFGLYASSDNSKYFEFTVMGRLNKGKPACRVSSEGSS